MPAVKKVGLGVRELVAARGGESLELWAKTINPQFARVLKTIGFDRTWARGEGAYLWDAKGDRYLDMLGGFGMFNVGRNNPRVRAALVEALELDLPGLGAARRLAAAAAARRGAARADAARLARVLFTSTGTEAVEAALKLGRAATGRGRGRLARARLPRAHARLALGERERRSSRAASGRCCPDFAQVPFGDLEALEAELRREDVAVFIVEPVQGKGVHLPPDGYLAGAQELCRRYGTLFCVDEVQTGFGRTGKLFAFEHWGLEPDLVPVAKSLSGGYVPVGALLMSADGARARLRLDGERVQPRLDVRAERARDGGRARDAGRARRPGRSSSVRRASASACSS